MDVPQKLKLHRWKDVEKRLFSEEQQDAARMWAEQEIARLQGRAEKPEADEDDFPALKLLRRVASGEAVPRALLIEVLMEWLLLQPGGGRAVHILEESPFALSAALDLAGQILRHQRASAQREDLSADEQTR